MNLTKCERGHFYDGDKFTSCPHCKSGAGESDTTESLDRAGGPATDYFRSNGGDVTVGTDQGVTDAWTADDTGWGNTGGDVKTEAADFGYTPAQPGGAAMDTVSGGPTEPLYRNNPGVGAGTSSSAETVPLSHIPDPYKGPIGGTPVIPNMGGRESLIDMVEKVSGTVTPADDSKTIGFYEEKGGIDPVVGWLVCIKGEEIGKSFVLKSGKNFIGRDSKSDVALKDRSVSRQCHAILLYDPKSRMFLVQPGTSRELFYLNDKVVLGVEAIQSNDILSIGKTDLMFIPCCGPNFCWEDHIEKINEEVDKGK